MAVNYFVIISHEREILSEEARKRALGIARVLAANSADAIASINTHDLQMAVDQVKHLDEVQDVYIVSPDRRIEASSDLDKLARFSDDPMVKQAMSENREVDRFTTDPSSLGHLEIALPIAINNRPVGAVKITMILSHLAEVVARSRAYIFALTVLLFIGSFLFMVLVAQWFAGPINRLADVARAVAEGDLDRRAEVRSGDELAVLADALNDMSSKLKSQMENEREAREHLQSRVQELLTLAERVSGGDLETPQAPEGNDAMGRLAAGFNDMVRNLRLNSEVQRATLFELEASSGALAEANRQLKELDRLKSEFLNTVSHELRTPLTSIKAFSEILLDSKGEDLDTQQEFLNIINQESDRLSRLINNLLDLSRIEAGRMQWDMDITRIVDVTEPCVQALRALVERKGVKLEVDVPPELTVVGDRDKLIQVVNNLLSNALKFTSMGGKIALTAERKGEYVKIIVADTGKGIPAEFHDKIFEKFQQVDTSSTREAKGSGLGLPIVRSIVEAHGGKVVVESEAGVGSKFIVSLPIEKLAAERLAALAAQPPRGLPPQVITPESEEPAEAAAAPRATAETAPGPEEPLAPPRPPRRILVVDDEHNIVRVMRHILESEGYEVLEANSGKEALELAKSEHPDLMLLDVLLPDIDGFAVLEELRKDESLNDLPVVILSILEAKEESFRLGAQDYFNKPIDRTKLLDTVQNLLGDANKEIKILVVDDDPNILRAIQQMLSHRGYRVVLARDGLEAVVRARDENPQLIVLDLYMPEMDGFEVIKRLRSWDETAHIPILVLTASNVALDEAKALTLGAERYVCKPFTEKELSRVVRDALTRAMARAEHARRVTVTEDV
jgi:signal transduction histidine kinase/DNA-binding response OmpR family regulator